MSIRKLELLAPAPTAEIGIAAINHGADAVYIGGPAFGARAAASNSMAAIERLIRHAHLFGARVYIALNTLFHDNEIEEAVRLCHQLHAIGADALIIQDSGLLECDLPPIELHASTQMDNRSPEKVAFLEKVGFRQVVLARELNLQQIAAIRKTSSVRLEFFIHGALCVCYSGQCYISEVLADRSANRGRCAQFCRHKYTVSDMQRNSMGEGYFLSLKDLNQTKNLETLIDHGIDSFKIEGRLKDEKYVKNITAHYRLQLDSILTRRKDLLPASSGSCSFAFLPDPEKTFNRGQTEYFLRKKRRKSAEIRSPKSSGKFLGRILQVRANSFLLDSEQPVHNGDGLCFFHPQRGLLGFRVNRVKGTELFLKDPPAKVALSAGTEIFRNVDTQFNKLLGQSKNCRKINLQVILDETRDGLHLEIIDEDGIRSRTESPIEKEKATSPGSSEKIAKRQLQKTGGTPFEIQAIQTNLDPALFLPASSMNELRRRAFAAHEEVRKKQNRPAEVQTRPNDVPWPGKEISYLDNIYNKKSLAFYLRHGARREEKRELLPEAINNPRLMTTKYCIKAQLGICPQTTPQKGTTGPLILSDNKYHFCLHFDCDKCEMIVKKY